MAVLLTLIEPSSVRRVIDPSYAVSELPDEAILDPIFAESAILEVLGLDLAAATREGDSLTHVKNALNLLVAARILPTLRFVTKEDIGDAGGISYQAVNVSQRVTELRRQAVAELSAVVGVAPNSEPATFLFVS